MHDWVIGPCRGSYIAAYACPVGELGESYIGYYKIYRTRPRSYLDTGHLATGTTPQLFASAEAAAHNAIAEATIALGHAPAVLQGKPDSRGDRGG